MKSFVDPTGILVVKSLADETANKEYRKKASVDTLNISSPAEEECVFKSDKASRELWGTMERRQFADLPVRYSILWD